MYTTEQRLAINKFFNLCPQDKYLDALVGKSEDGGAIEAEVTAAIAECEANLQAWKDVLNSADGITAGCGGATFNIRQEIDIKMDAYDQAVDNLARLLDIPGYGRRYGSPAAICGFFSL